MTNSGFTHLHVHSDASKDGLRPVDQLVKAAYDYGFRALALTDHGSLANAVSFTLVCKSFGIKPVVGTEAYINVDGKTCHLTLLGNGQKGLENLIRLNNIGHASKGKAPEFSLDDLLADCRYLICLSGCVASPFNQLPFGEAVSLMNKFKHAFSNRFFMETMHIADLDTWTRPIKLAEKGNVPLVITNDTHFPLRDDANIHQLITKMRAGFSYNSTELWLKPVEQIWKRAKGNVSRDMFDEAIENTAMIAEKIKATEFNTEPTLPHIPNADQKLAKLVNENLGRISSTKEYKKRVAHELGIISKMDYSSYFVILNDIISEAKKLGAYIGPGRGSGAGSLVLYTLGITGIDPMEYNLPFERFLNPSRKGMPDVDVDIDTLHRDTVIDYVSEKWSGVPIGTVVRYSHKSAVHDLAKALKVPRDIDEAVAENGPNSRQMKALEESNPDFEAAYGAIIGQIRHRGRHPAGVVITERAIPIERASGHLVASWTEGKYGEMSKAGIVKYDLLGLEALTILNLLEKGNEKEAKESKLHEDDDPAFELFRKGDLSGVFQFSGSPGIRTLTMKLAPREFGDLIALNALYRPGALDAGTADKFVEWKKKPRKVPTLIADILAPTYGAIVYQEQVMALYARVTGGSLAESDNIRRTIVKAQDKFDDPEWQEQFNDIKTKFIEGSVERGISRDGAQRIWKEIATHSRYSFNKAHATAYAQIAWQMAWWKYYHPLKFYAAMMSSDRENLQQYIFEVVERGIRVSMPSINKIGDDDIFIVDGDTIIVPANVIKYVTNVKPIRDELRKNGPFKSIEDFMARIPKNAIRGQARAALAALGAFSSIKGSIKELSLSEKSVEIIAQIKKSPNPEKQAQVEFLGFFIPSFADLKQIKEAKEKGMVAGIISEIKDKTSKFGAYKVFYLSPNGLFWTRGMNVSSLQVGDLVMAKVKSNSGKALKIRKL